MIVMSTKQVANDASFHYSEKRPRTAVRMVVSIGRGPQRAGVIAVAHCGPRLHRRCRQAHSAT